MSYLRATSIALLYIYSLLLLKSTSTLFTAMLSLSLLQEVRSKKAVVVMVVDLTDASGTLMGKVGG